MINFGITLPSSIDVQSSKASDEAILEISVLGGIVSWKIVSVLKKFCESSLGKFEVFSLHSRLPENLMCSRNLFKKVASGKRTDI